MRRYIRRATPSASDRLREQFNRQLERDADALLRDLTQKFRKDIEQQTVQLAQTLMQQSAASFLPNTAPPTVPVPNTYPGTGMAASPSLTAAQQILAGVTRYLIRRPTFSKSTEESSRSRDSETAFRLSQSQQAAEAQALIARGEKSL